MERNRRFFSESSLPAGVAAALFVVLALYVFVAYSNYRVLVEQELGAHEALLERVVSESEGFMRSRLELLEVLADTITLFEQTSGQRKDVLALFLSRHPEFGRISILDDSGWEIFADSRFATLRQTDFKNFSQDKNFTTARNGGVFVGSLHAGIAKGTIHSVRLSVPVFKNSETVQEVIMAELDLRQLWDIVSLITVGGRGAAYLTDGAGSLVAHPDKQFALSSVNIGERAPLAQIINSTDISALRIYSGTYNNQENRNVLGMAQRLSFGWIASVEEPVEDFFRTSRTLLSINTAVFAGAGVLGIFLLLFSRSFSKVFRAREEERAEKSGIIENLSDGLLIVNSDGSIDFMNKKARVFLFADNVDNGTIINPSMRGGALGLLPEVLFPEGVTDGFFRYSGMRREYHFFEPIEQYFEVEVLSVPLSENTRVRAFLLIHDVTRDRVLSHLKSEFISIAAHQLRTPLSAIKWVFRLLLDGDLGQISSHQRTYISEGYDTNERMIHLVNDLLSVSRIEEGRFDFSFKKGNIAATLFKTVAGLEKIAEERGVGLVVEQPRGTIPDIYFDEERMAMVFQNLLENAVHYTNPKGSVGVAISHDEKHVVIRVSDTGIGISKSEQTRLFVKFYRAEGAARMFPNGTGLGLFIARNIILRHGGALRVESEVGKGSMFEIVLPVSETHL